MGFHKSTLSRTFSVCSGQVRGCGKLSAWAVFTLSVESVYSHSSLTFFGPLHGGQSRPRRPLPTWGLHSHACWWDKRFSQCSAGVQPDHPPDTRGDTGLTKLTFSCECRPCWAAAGVCRQVGQARLGQFLGPFWCFSVTHSFPVRSTLGIHGGWFRDPPRIPNSADAQVPGIK